MRKNPGNVPGVVLVVFAIILGVLIFAVMLAPVISMRSEKDTIMALSSLLAELRADVNKIDHAPLASQKREIEETHDALKEAFTLLDHVKSLRTDENIAQSLDTIGRLYTLQETNYGKFIVEVDGFIAWVSDFFYSDEVDVSSVLSTRLLETSENRDAFLTRVKGLLSSISILDANLAPEEQIVQEQFVIVNALILSKERHAYFAGLLVILVIGVVAYVVADRIDERRRSVERVRHTDKG